LVPKPNRTVDCGLDVALTVEDVELLIAQDLLRRFEEPRRTGQRAKCVRAGGSVELVRAIYRAQGPGALADDRGIVDLRNTAELGTERLDLIVREEVLESNEAVAVEVFELSSGQTHRGQALR